MLPLVALGFIFSGFYKGQVESPIDLTVVAAVATCVLLLPFWRGLLPLAERPILVVLAILIGYLALRLLPGIPRWGVRKLGEILLFGAPALAAGYVIARQSAKPMLSILCFSSVPATIWVVLFAVGHSPYSYAWVGSGGYQLTGMFLGAGMVAAAASRNWMIFGIAALGLSVTGNLSGALFAAVAVLTIWIIQRDWRVVAKSITASLAWMGLYTLLIAPPLLVMRILWTSGAVLISTTAVELPTAFESGNYLNRYGLGRMIVSALKIMPKESQRYLVEAKSADRIDIYRDAAEKFLESPIFGNGYGAIKYLDYSYPHNVLLEMLAEGGVIAGGLFLILAFLILRQFWPPPTEPFEQFALGYILLVGLTAMVSGYFGGRLLIFGIGMALARCGAITVDRGESLCLGKNPIR